MQQETHTPEPPYPRLFRSFSAKLLLTLIPVFFLVAAVGYFLLSQYDEGNDSDNLAARVGNQAARIAGAIDRNAAQHSPPLARDLLSSLASDRAILCVEYRETATNRLIAAAPPRLGCAKTVDGHRLTVPVDERGQTRLHLIFSDEEITAAAEQRRASMLLLIGVAFIVSVVSALIGLQLIVTRPLTRLHTSIKRISDTGERIPVKDSAGSELGDIIDAFNEMIGREEEREQSLENANRKINELNLTLSGRVQRSTAEWKDSEQRIRFLIESFSSGIYIHAGFKPIYANQTLLDMLGYDGMDDFLSLDSTELLLAPEERDRIWGYHQARLRGDPAPTDYDFWALRKNGEKLYTNNRSFVVKWEGQDAVCTTLFDLTERRKTEKSLAEQQHLMSSLLQTTHEGFWFIGLDWLTTDLNPAMCRILGRPREEIIGRSIFDFVDRDNRKIFDHQIALRGKRKSGAYEISLQRPDGSNVPCLNNATPLFTSDGEQIGSVGMWADITEIKQVQRDLELETERAQAASIAKSEFMAVASHELRTPMNGVLGMASLILSSELSEQQRHQAELLKQSGESLLGLLNDILDISKIESGHLEIENRHFDIRKMLESVAALLESRARQKGILYANQVASDIPAMLVGDMTRIRQILVNIVANAVKFTAEGEIQIDVSHKSVGGDALLIRFDVTDTGIGIEEDAQARIFEKFTQADASTTRKFGGTGLGLAICKELAQRLGGQIGVESQIGSGSRFWFTALCKTGDGSKAEDTPASHHPAGHRASNKQFLRILVAEDNPVNQEIVKETLENAGHRVDIASNGFEAVDAVQKFPYDIVLMDVHMPEMDGSSATKIIRELPGDISGIPIIALTADAMAGDREKFIAAGMNDYVSKPFDNLHLFSTIRRYVRNSPANTQSAAPHKRGDNEPVHGLDRSIAGPLRDEKPDLWARLVGIYTENTPAHLDTLKQALAGGDFGSAHIAAHTLKSSSANMGAMRLSDLCRQLEEAVASANPNADPELLDEICAEFKIVSAELTPKDEIKPMADGLTA